MNKRLLWAFLLVAIGGAMSESLLAQTNAGSQAQSAGAQDNARISDQDIELLRKDLREKKKQFVAANLNLTVDQATGLWPVYDQ